MKNILVTGSSSGFGLLTVKTLAKEGHTVFATMRNMDTKNKEKAEAITVWASENDAIVHVVDLDVTSDSSVKSAVKETLSIVDRIDVVVNNAGVVFSGMMESFSSEDVHAQFNINVYGPIRVTNAVLPNMRKNGSGLIINITSEVGRMVFPFMGPYVSSKYALEAISESYYYELKKLGIDVVALEPGAYPTEIFGKVGSGSKTEVNSEYGELVKMQEGMFEGISSMFEGDNAPNPQDVADEINRLVELPAGNRPLRTIVDKSPMAKGPQVINDTADNVRKDMLTGMGMAELY